MALDLYEFDQDNNQYVKVSQNGLQTSPIQTSHDGTNGEVVEKKIYVRSDDTAFYYTNLQLKGTPARKVRVGDQNYPEAFIGLKLSAGDTQPTRNEWLAIESGNVMELDDIGDSNAGDNSYKPFWVQVNIPTGTRVQTIVDVSINVEADENPVGI